MKIFSSVWLHYENCCRKYFHMFSSILKMLFSYKFFKVSPLFSQHPNKFHYRKFQNHNHNHKIFKVSQLFSSHHYHTTITTTKIKIIESDRWVEGEIERRGAIGEIWCVRSSDWSSGFTGDVKGMIWASSPSSSARALSLSLSPSLSFSLCASDP